MEEEKIENGFFKRVWYSVAKLEKYPNMAAEGVPKAFNYFAKIILIFTIIFSVCLMYQTYNAIQDGIEVLKNSFPEFSYKNNNLNLENDTKKVEYDLDIGKVIIDTNEKEEADINNYANSINSGIIVLKDKVILKNISTLGSSVYKYEDFLSQAGIREFSKQSLIEYVNSTKMIRVYFSIFITIFIYSFAIYFISILFNIFIISIFGYLTSLLTKIKMRYAAIFNLSVYAMTLSIIMQIIYITINMFIDFNITYFQVAYISVASIYLVAAIFMIKSDFIKKQLELTKIMEIQKNINKESDQEQKEDKPKEDEKENNQEQPKDEENNDKKTDGPEEPEGSQA